MYADRYATGPTIKPGSASLALVATALPLVAMVLGLQVEHMLKVDKTIETYVVPPDHPPPPDPDRKVKPRESSTPREKLFVPQTPQILDKTPMDTTIKFPEFPPPPDPPSGTGEGLKVEPVKPVPVIVAAQIDPRYAGLLQPPYPSEEVRAGRNGRVVVRVLIGADGRVRQVERIEAASDAFFAAAQRQALTKWRFKPATRDGVAFEQWKVMTLRFELHDE